MAKKSNKVTVSELDKLRLKLEASRKALQDSEQKVENLEAAIKTVRDSIKERKPSH